MDNITRTYIERELLFQWLVDELLKHGQETREEIEVFIRKSLLSVMRETEHGIN